MSISKKWLKKELENLEAERVNGRKIAIKRQNVRILVDLAAQDTSISLIYT